MRDSKYLLPDNQETIRATEILAKEGFVVLPYMYPDLNVARDLVQAGAAAVMPLAAPIGSNKGLATREFLQILIDEIELPIIVDAGIGRRRGDGKYRAGDGRRPAAHGFGVPRGGFGGSQGVSERARSCAAPRRGSLGPSDGLFA